MARPASRRRWLLRGSRCRRRASRSRRRCTTAAPPSAAASSAWETYGGTAGCWFWWVLVGFGRSGWLCLPHLPGGPEEVGGRLLDLVGLVGFEWSGWFCLPHLPGGPADSMLIRFRSQAAGRCRLNPGPAPPSGLAWVEPAPPRGSTSDPDQHAVCSGAGCLFWVVLVGAGGCVPSSAARQPGMPGQQLQVVRSLPPFLAVIHFDLIL